MHTVVSYRDGYHRKVLDNLQGFASWLTAVGAKGYISEVGWPSLENRTLLGGPDDGTYAELAEAFYQIANQNNLWVTANTATEGDAYYGRHITIYGPASTSGAANTAHVQASVLESYPTTQSYWRGVVFNGGERAQAGFSAASRGTYATDYTYPSQSTVNYLYSRGVRLIRLPVKWERLQPTLSAALDTTEVGRINTFLGYVTAAGSDMQVILEPYNFGGYNAAGTFNAIGSGSVTAASFTDFWTRMSNASLGFGSNAAVLGFGLMHQPHVAAMSIANWQTYSQSAVTAIRANTTTKYCLVPIYGYSGQQALDNHGTAWITDAQGLTRYEAQHWFDGAEVGAYSRSYASQRQVWYAPTARDRGIGSASHGFYDNRIYQNPVTFVQAATNLGGDNLDEAARATTRMPAVVNFFVPWLVSGYQDFPAARIAKIEERGAVPYISWTPQDWNVAWNTGVNVGVLGNIVAGTYDSYIQTFAGAVRDYEKPIRVRLMPETNASGRAWFYNGNSNTGAAQFVAAFQHVVNLCRAAGAGNITWVWCVAGSIGEDYTIATLNSLYPGNSYTDETAADIYNVGTSGITWGGAAWHTLTEILTTPYANITGTVAPSKPFHIAEMSSAEAGGSKAGWITNAYTMEFPNAFPLVRMALWFSVDNTSIGETNWRIDSSSASANAYAAAVTADYWQKPVL